MRISKTFWGKEIVITFYKHNIKNDKWEYRPSILSFSVHYTSYNNRIEKNIYLRIGRDVIMGCATSSNIKLFEFKKYNGIFPESVVMSQCYCMGQFWEAGQITTWDRIL